MTKPEPPPEAVLIRRVRQAAQISVTEAARAAGISKPWWSMIEAGHSTRSGVTRPVVAKADVLAAMARVVGLDPDRLHEVRPDAADILAEAIRPGGAGSAGLAEPGVAVVGQVAPEQGAEEAELAAFSAQVVAEYPEFADLAETLMSEEALTTGDKLGLLAMARALRQARGDASGRSA